MECRGHRRGYEYFRRFTGAVFGQIKALENIAAEILKIIICDANIFPDHRLLLFLQA